MNHKVILRRLAFSTLLLPLSALAQPPAPSDDSGQLEVTATAQVTASPDRATLSARLWERTALVRQDAASASDPESVRDARARLEQRMRQLIDTLESQNVAQKAITAGTLRLATESVSTPSPDTPHPEWRVRTRVERPLTVELTDVDQVADVIDTLTEAGADAIQGVTYDLADREAPYNQALAKAIAVARQRAHTLTTGLDSRLGRVLLVKDADTHPAPPPQYPMAARMASMSQDARPESDSEYRPGTLDVSATVSVTWALADAP